MDTSNNYVIVLFQHVLGFYKSLEVLYTNSALYIGHLEKYFRLSWVVGWVVGVMGGWVVWN
jgi:hypothetical protein